MASNDEGQGSGDCDDIYRAANEFFSLADDQPVASGTETDTQTGAETETGAETQTGIGTGAETETGAASGSGASVERKQRGNGFLTNSGLLDWWSRRWTTAILSQPGPRKHACATAIK